MMRCFDCANRSEGWNKEKTHYCDWCSVTGQRIDLDEPHEDCSTFVEWVDDCEGHRERVQGCKRNASN